MPVKLMKKHVSVSAVVLGAGGSSRMGTQKLLLPFGSKSVIRTVVENLRLAGVSDVVVVTGYEAEKLRAHLAGVNVRFVHNRRHRTGDMHTSVRCGFRAVEDAALAFLTPGDLPLVHQETIRSLIDAFDPKAGISAAVPVCDHRRGHPVLLNRTCRNKVLRSRTGMALKRMTATGHPGVRLIEVNDPGIYVDLDTPEDYKRVLEQLPR